MAENNRRPARRLLVIHHSHTDVGYTEMQQRITRWQIDFIRQALNIIDTQNSGEPEKPRFIWNCESFWAVEKFLEKATKSEFSKLREALQLGDIGLSGNYLNFNELIDYDVLLRVLRRAAEFGESIGVRVDSAMTADINGYSWGYSQALHDCGMKNLFTCIHTHHGMFPLGKRHTPFWWETPHGEKILVWNGEHYHYGNELGIVPGAVSSYITKDECDAEMIFGDHWAVAEIRIPRLFKNLSESAYPYDFVPVMASGLRTDNGPPSRHITEFIERWNREHGDEYYIEMTTLSGFFHLLRKQKVEIPTYRGDWPDWWSDGVASAPEYNRIFRQAQRDLRYYEMLIKRYPDLQRENLDDIDNHLALYAEHTFGHSDSVSRPWRFMTGSIAARKKAYAAIAYESTQSLIDNALAEMGATTLKTDMPLRYRIINPVDSDIEGIARLAVGHYEFNELKLDKGAVVKDLSDNNILPHQVENAPMGAEFCIYTKLASGEEKEFEISPRSQVGENRDVNSIAKNDFLETPFVKISWSADDGITSWYDKSEKRELLRDDRKLAPFTPVYEITPEPDDNRICVVRGEMGLNRKGKGVIRSIGKMTGIENNEDGDIFAKTTLCYKTDGMEKYWLDLRAYNHQPRVDVTIRTHKKSVWEPENVYLPLPFGQHDSDSQLWFDKTGSAVRPRVDQLPGTLTDFYSIQEGLTINSPGYGIAIATPDTSLIQIGDLDYGERKLFDTSKNRFNNFSLYAWLMTNYWETNFDAELGGFYEFRFYILWGSEYNDPEQTLRRIRDINHGLRCFRLRKGGK